MALTLLIAGFGSFPGAPVNPSARVVARLARVRRPAFADLRRVAHVFATRYDAVGRDLPALIAREQPDAIVLFGVATKSKRLRIEVLARNRMSLVFPDAGGFKPERGPIELGGPSAIAGAPPARLLAAVRSAGGGAALSRHAGTYLCNYAYWHALEAVRMPGGPRLAVFIHMPKLRIKPTRARAGKRPRRLADFARAGEAIVLAVAAMTRSTRFVPPSGFRNR